MPKNKGLRQDSCLPYSGLCLSLIQVHKTKARPYGWAFFWGINFSLYLLNLQRLRIFSCEYNDIGCLLHRKTYTSVTKTDNQKNRADINSWLILIYIQA